MTTTKSLVFLIVAMIFGLKAFAQEEKTERPVQISFIYPIGTNGLNSINYSNKFSLNIIYGLNGGVNDGIELGSVLNINKGNVKGIQLAGVSNLTWGNSNGAIISGVLNTGSSHEGVQLSTINVVSEKITGAQMGVINVAKEIKGIQLSTINVASKKMDGAQIGLINLAKVSKGVQVGLINIANNADSIIPFGLINVVKGGYYAFELSTNELLLSNLAFKMGVKKFHTFFRVGVGSFNNKRLFTTGGGFGSIIPIKDNHKLNIELICDRIIYDNNWSDEGLNLLNQLSFAYQYQITDFFAVKAGPSIRNYLTNQKINGEFNTIKVPYTILENTFGEVKSSTWIGFNVGVVISF